MAQGKTAVYRTARVDTAVHDMMRKLLEYRDCCIRTTVDYERGRVLGYAINGDKKVVALFSTTRLARIKPRRRIPRKRRWAHTDWSYNDRHAKKSKKSK